jgi:SAM-dependent methyltransferase
MISQGLKNDIIEWDISNWSKALDFWDKHVDVSDKGYSCLELGGRRGGLSLWLAVNGNKVICSDLASPEESAKPLHEKHAVTENISYQGINAVNIPFENEFDLVVFKSILGGVSGNGRDELKKKMIDEIYKSIKPGGKLLFAENLESSFFHQFIRKKFTNWGDRWNYLNYAEMDHVFSSFDKISYGTWGFLATFGRSEGQRRFLGKIDALIQPFIPKKKRYIVFGVAEKF